MYVTRTSIFDKHSDKTIFAQFFNFVSENKNKLDHLIKEFYDSDLNIDRELLKIEIMEIPCDIPTETIQLLNKNKHLNCYINIQYRDNDNFTPLIATIDESEYENQNIFISKVRYL